MTALLIQNAKVINYDTCASTSIRVLTWPGGASRSLIEYCLNKRRSRSWQQKLLRAVKLFLEFSEVTSIRGQNDRQLFCNFRNALSSGTIDLKTREDPSGLYWKPIGVVQANYMIIQLSDFFEWLGHNEQQLSDKNVADAEKFSQRYTGNRYDQRIDWQAYLYRRNRAFLGHLWSMKPKEVGLRVKDATVRKAQSSSLITGDL